MARLQKIIIVLLSVSTLFAATIVSAEILIVAFGSYHAEPYAFVKGKQLVGGVIKDVMDELGKELGIEVDYKSTPKKRIEDALGSGKMHVAAISNPAWVKDSEQYHWSIPLFQESSRFLVSAKLAFPITTFEDLHGKRLGTILGYYYPELMEKFESKAILRDDAIRIETNFKRLQAGRIDALIDSDILIAYHLKKHNAYQQFVIAEKVVSTHDIQSAVSKQTPISIDRINTTLQEMKDSGKITEILEKYK